MLFNSYIFIFLFLPVTVVVYYFLRQSGHTRGAIVALIIASFIFYAWWSVKYVFLLMGLMIINFAVAREIASCRESKPKQAKLYLIFGLLFNLGALGYYKYANFFVENLSLLFGFEYTMAQIILPIGISFFTFQKIAFLVDAYQGKVKTFNPLSYALFVIFFPQLIAGPIVHHSEIIPQFNNPPKLSYPGILLALTIFIIGLSKKVLIADNVALYSSPHFNAAATGVHLDFLTAWSAALAYTAQIYFDFSAYSDMAIGIGLLFGVKLPINFNSPYKSKSIIEFWRRWHITLSRFLRDYLYIPLGGNRKGEQRRYVNMLITMLLGGIWHGAGWTFLIWGGLHGLYLIINHAWRTLTSQLFTQPLPGRRLFSSAGWVLSFLCVVVAWVFFRAADVKTASDILRSMSDISSLNLAAHSGLGLLVPVLCLGVAFTLPNTQQLTSYIPYSPENNESQAGAALEWQPTGRWLVYTGLLFALCLMSLTQVSEFIYFQF